MAYRTTNSTLYGYDYNADATGTINSSNGAWTILNSSPGTSMSAPIGGRYSIMNDVMYFAGNGGGGPIGTMGYTNTSNYQVIALDMTYANIVLANDGTTMYGIFGGGTAGNQKLYTINTATGALTAGPTISGTGLGTYFHGAGIATVPEPSTYALAAIATGVMAAIARRRKAARA
ncbi:MAG: PEP-CTERM sorting domain-containing protein [Planctomycetota bacterium]|nr:PEP-CTERM sorting domain-containing protein [Planctomycetota bacterium]